MTEASDAATSLGLADPARSYRVRRIGQWANDTFQTGPSQSVTWPVSRFITGPGRYEVAFHYDDRGWYGVEIRQVRLVSAAKDAAPSAELARDAHQGISRSQSKNSTYQLALKTYDPAAALFRRRRLGGHSFDRPERSFRVCRLCHHQKVQRTSRKRPSPVIGTRLPFPA